MAAERFVIFTGLWPGGAHGGASGSSDSSALGGAYGGARDSSDSSALGYALPETRPGDFIACADGGYNVCAMAGVQPDIVIGDFDSLSIEQIAEIDELCIERLKHPSEKDDTDTMLCAKYGVAHGHERFLLVGGVGGDFGHTMANIQVLSFLSDMGCRAEIVSGGERLFMADGRAAPVHGEARPAVPALFKGRTGERFSVLSYSERSTGVYIKNARYPLDDATLTQSYPIGVSNEFINGDTVEASVRTGRLLIIANR